jgi:hypothetical protein
VLITLKADADPKTAEIDAPIELGNKPEYLAADGTLGEHMWLNKSRHCAVLDVGLHAITAFIRHRIGRVAVGAARSLLHSASFAPKLN